MATVEEKPDPDRLLGLFERMRSLTAGEHPLQDSEVSMPQLALLDWIAGAPGSGIQEIAEGLGLTAPTVSVGVRRLEEAGLLERRPHPEDGRAIQAFLTPRGRSMHERARAFRHEKMRRLLAGLTADEGAALLALLEKAITAAEKAADE